MGILNIFKKSAGEEKPDDQAKPAAKPAIEKKIAPKAEAVNKPAKTAKTIKKDNLLSYRVLIKPLVTEKAAELGVLNKYVFEIAPSMNKIEVKKAILSVYGIEPISVNIINMLGKAVRYGRASGTTKDWKKAIVTLKAGDKIEVYHGV